MKRILVILLIFIAIPLWVWNTNLVLKGAFAHTKHSKSKAKVALTGMISNRDVAVHTRFEAKGRSPFTPYKEDPKPKFPANAFKKNFSQPVVGIPAVSPPITINGIMWNETNPVAMIQLSDGSSTVVKNGQTLAGGIVIKAIEKDQVQVEYKGALYRLKK